MKILISLACLAVLAVPCFGQIVMPLFYVDEDVSNLSLVDVNTGLSSETLAPGTTSLTLAVDLTGASTISINAFGIQLSGSTSAATALPTGITLTSFTTTPLVQNLSIGQNVSAYEYGATDGTTNFLQLSSTPATLVDVNFTLSGSLTPGSMYTIDFAPTGSFQNLTIYSGGQTSSLGYTQTNFTFTASPEPPVSALLALAGLAALAWRILRGPRPASWA